MRLLKANKVYKMKILLLNGRNTSLKKQLKQIMDMSTKAMQFDDTRIGLDNKVVTKMEDEIETDTSSGE